MNTAATSTPVEAVSSSMITNPGAALSGSNSALSSSVLNPSTASAFGVPNAAAQPLTTTAAYGMPSANQLAAGITNTAGKSAIDLAATEIAESAPSFGQGVKNIMSDPWKFIKNNPGTTASVALPFLGAKGPATIPEAKKEESNYKGPYKLVRDVSFPTDRDPNDSSEYTYFRNPRILSAGEYAAGGQVDTYNPDNPGAATNLSRDGYGLASFKMQNPDPQPFQIAQQPSPMAYAHGGYLDGPGDGMSDSIPATIAGKQPARLADGEFVVPADVVSHLGNGSTKAGAQRLYAMMDKVRKARTGNTKQGRQINPHKFLPA
jgi:archaellin